MSGGDVELSEKIRDVKRLRKKVKGNNVEGKKEK